MRTRWVTGSATGVDGNFPGRYVTPWREDENVLQPDGSGIDNPSSYPFGQMTTKQFIACIARVYSWEVTWAASFKGPNYEGSWGGKFTSTPRSRFSVPGRDVGINEEYRWGAGFLWQVTEEVPSDVGTASISFLMGGRHQYQLPGAVNQRFRPLLNFSFALDIGEADNGNWTILSNRIAAQSIGLSTFSFESVDAVGEDTYFPPYYSQQGMSFAGIGTSILVGPATVTAQVGIRPKLWWPYRDGNGLDPIYDTTSGAKLRSTRAAPSTQPVGQQIGSITGLPGTRFVA